MTAKFAIARLVAILATLCTACAHHPTAVRIDDELEGIRRSSGSPAIAAAAANSHELLATGVAGFPRQGDLQRVQPGQSFHVGSVAKPFTATLAGLLVAEGRLRWDDKLVDTMPDCVAVRTEYRDITLADLLSHESGLRAFESEDELAGLSLAGDARTQRRAFTCHALTLEPAVARGVYRYSNAGFVAAAAMVEVAADRSWESLVRTRIAEPLHLETLGFGWPANGDSRQPWGHAEGANGLFPHDPQGPYQLPLVLAPAGDLNMSVDDLAEFLADHLRALRGEPALLPQSVALVMHQRRVRSGLGFGVGKVGDLQPVSMYSGSADTFLALVALAPVQNVAVAVAANAADPKTEAALKDLLKTLLARYAAPASPVTRAAPSP